MKEILKKISSCRPFKTALLIAAILLTAGLGTAFCLNHSCGYDSSDIALHDDDSLEAILISSLSYNNEESEIIEKESLRYAIKSGDTLDAISKRYNISVDTLILYNDIEDASRLFPGMIIRIPL